MAMHNSGPLVYRRMSSWTKFWHYLSASSHRRSTSVTLSDKP
jgi:hypothetical protein